MKIDPERAVTYAVVALVLIFVVVLLSGCEVPEATQKRVKEWKEMPQVESTRYRVSRNILLYDVTLKDGTRCVLVTTGGTYCEFVK